jgi:hypothetical protein
MTKEFILDQGEIGFYLYSGRVSSGVVDEIIYTKTSTVNSAFYHIKDTLLRIEEGFIFKSKEELIASL